MVLLASLGLASFTSSANAAEPDPAVSDSSRVPIAKAPIYAEVGLGLGKTLFLGNMKPALRSAYGGAFTPGLGNNLMMGFAVAPRSLRGLGVGAQIKGTFGGSVRGEEGDNYIFNEYALGVMAKYYIGGSSFNQGPYAKVALGFGQMTTKRLNEAVQRFRHQYAIGLSLMGAVGYSLPLGPAALSLELGADYASRSGTVDGVGNTTFQSGQLAGNLLVSF